jgi:hypothetical protein
MAKTIPEILSYLAEFPEVMTDAMKIIDDTMKYNKNANEHMMAEGSYSRFINKYYQNITIPKGDIN